MGTGVCGIRGKKECIYAEIRDERLWYVAPRREPQQWCESRMAV